MVSGRFESRPYSQTRGVAFVVSMTNYGSFHGCNVPAHASKELCVRSHSEKRRQRVDFYSRRGTMAGLKVPGTVFVARIIPFGIRIGKSVDHPMEKEEIEGDRRGGRGRGGKSRVRSRGLVSFLEGISNEKTISCTSTRERFLK